MEKETIIEIILDETYQNDVKTLEKQFNEFQEKYNQYIGGVQVSKLGYSWRIEIVTLGKSAVELLSKNSD